MPDWASSGRIPGENRGSAARVGVGKHRKFPGRKRKTADQGGERGIKFAALSLIRQICLVCPVENRPQIPLQNCALHWVTDLALRVGTQEFIGQRESSVMGFSAQQIARFARKKGIQSIESVLLSVGIRAHVQQTVQPIGNVV